MIEKNISDEFQNNGVVLLKKIIDQKWIDELRKGVEHNFQNPSKYKCVYEEVNNQEIFYDDYCNWQRIKEYRNFIFNSNIAKIAGSLMKSKKVNLFHEHVLIKEKGSKKRTPWHQDQGYYCVQGRDNVSIWIPLDTIDINSSMEFIVGSHKWNKIFLPTKFKGYDYDHKDKEFEKIPDIENNRKDYEIISYECELGDAIAFNYATIHAAYGNNSNNRRRAFSVRFTGDDARYIKRKGEMSPPFPNINLKNKIIIDAGCGSGTKTIPLAFKSKAKKVIGIDGSKSAIKNAKFFSKELKVKNVVFLNDKLENLNQLINKLNSLTLTYSQPTYEIEKIKTEKNEILRQKIELENKNQELLREHRYLKEQIKNLQLEVQKKLQLENDFNQEIEELSQEAESLVSEIEKWQM